jgi:hypothetical protein
MLKNITRGKVSVPHFVLIYAGDGIGKSTFASKAPAPIFLGSEDGTNNLDVARFPAITTFAQAEQAVDELINQQHDFKTLAVDSLDWLEPLLWKDICTTHGKPNIEEFGYGKGYVLAVQKWQGFVAKLLELRTKKKMNIVLIAHAQVKAFHDPSQPSSYDRFQLKLNDKAAALFREAVDTVLFATFETFVKKDGAQKARAFGEGKRVVFTERRPAFDAKNRAGLPFEIDLSWDAFVDACNNSKPDQLKQIKQDISDLIETVTDESLKALMTKSVQDAGSDLETLKVILNRIKVRLGGH